MPLQQMLLNNKQEEVVIVVTANPSSVFLSSTVSGPLSQAVVVGASGGTPPYTYNTVWSSGGAGISINSPTSSMYGVSSTASPVTFRSGQATTTVTDANGNIGIVEVPVDFVWET